MDSLRRLNRPLRCSIVPTDFSKSIPPKFYSALFHYLTLTLTLTVTLTLALAWTPSPVPRSIYSSESNIRIALITIRPIALFYARTISPRLNWNGSCSPQWCTMFYYYNHATLTTRLSARDILYRSTVSVLLTVTKYNSSLLSVKPLDYSVT